jgi:phosphonate degradation associated HDIG domain protein
LIPQHAKTETPLSSSSLPHRAARTTIAGVHVVDEIITLYRERGDAMYFGEPVTQLAHALQAAWLAELDGSDDALVIAALLHDIGHLLHGRDEAIAGRTIDARHERIGATWLARHFDAAVSEPVRLHVAAKRYLCAVERQYLNELSTASVQSLALQGGPLTPAAAHEFEAQPAWRAAVRLRRWDDRAKVVGLAVPGLEGYGMRMGQLAVR